MFRPIIYKCPQTGMNVQHWLPAASDDAPKATHGSVVCAACRRLHFINNLTGKLLGEE